MTKLPLIIVILFLFSGCNQGNNVTLNSSTTTLDLIPLDQPCDVKETALPMAGICPKNNIIANAKQVDEYKTFTVNSPDGYANIHFDGYFPGEKDRSNILVTLADKQRFCGYEHIKPNYNGDGSSFAPELGVPLDGEKGSLAFVVLLQDTNGKYCKGYISASLVSTGQ